VSKNVVVVPAPNIKPPLYVRGIPASGKSLTPEEARPLIDAGLVVIREPVRKPATTKKESD